MSKKISFFFLIVLLFSQTIDAEESKLNNTKKINSKLLTGITLQNGIYTYDGPLSSGYLHPYLLTGVQAEVFIPLIKDKFWITSGIGYIERGMDVSIFGQHVKVKNYMYYIPFTINYRLGNFYAGGGIDLNQYFAYREIYYNSGDIVDQRIEGSWTTVENDFGIGYILQAGHLSSLSDKIWVSTRIFYSPMITENFGNSGVSISIFYTPFN